MADVVQKLWAFCHVLRHDGIDYGDYIEQITYLLFMKMADERGVDLPTGCSWPELEAQSGTTLTDHYADALRTLGKQPGILGDIFAGSMPRFNNPVNLKKLISLIDETEWTSLDKDVKAEAFEGLLEKAASEGKKGAGQFFTPRPLIQSICDVMRPDPRPRSDITVYDPAVGTAGFLVCAYEWLLAQTGGAFDRDVAKRIKSKTYFGQELVARPRRLALMNLFLHNVEPIIYLGDTIYESPSSERFDIILTNPPFGTKGASQMPDRDDFTVETSNKQLNFVQHVLTVLKPGGRAAVVLPDNCLFADQAGEVFEILTKDCDLHTVLRLPRGTFTPYSQGVKANVVFLTKRLPDREHVDLRLSVEHARHHQEGPAAQQGPFRGVRRLLRHRPERSLKAEGRGLEGRPLARVPHQRGQGAGLQARLVQVDQGREHRGRGRASRAGGTRHLRHRRVRGRGWRVERGAGAT